jgi:type II secretory pathway component PulF
VRSIKPYRPSFLDYIFPVLGSRDRSALYRQFATRLHAGLNYKKLQHALRAQKPSQKRFIDYLKSAMQSEIQLSTAFNAQPLIPEWQTYWIKIGEKSGKISEVFADLSEEEKFLSKEKDTFFSKLTRPALTVLIACFLSQIGPLILGEISLTTYLVNALKPLFWVTVIALFGMYCFRSKKISQPWRLKLEQIGWKIPKLSTYLKEVASYRFCSSLLRCLEAGIPIVKAMQMSVETTGSEAARAAWPRVSSMMLRQVELHTAISALGFVSPYAISQIIVGQKSGRLDRALADIRKNASDESKQAIHSLLRAVGFVFQLLVIYFLATQFF